jgi:hypothetical protein
MGALTTRKPREPGAGISISLGVLIGAAVYRAVNAGLHRLPMDHSTRTRRTAASGRNGVLSSWRLPWRREMIKKV